MHSNDIPTNDRRLTSLVIVTQSHTPIEIPRVSLINLSHAPNPENIVKTVLNRRNPKSIFLITISINIIISYLKNPYFGKVIIFLICIFAGYHCKETTSPVPEYIAIYWECCSVIYPNGEYSNRKYCITGTINYHLSDIFCG